ncbi:DUF1573 domain-containing protein [Flavobacterium sp. MAHUQ-51]|uniref:DUF1573 domain-containing protein n=1 Tax=Flavobacterium sp. GCM10022190 TaxID=3252639 RepID=UPI00361F63DB
MVKTSQYFKKSKNKTMSLKFEANLISKINFIICMLMLTTFFYSCNTKASKSENTTIKFEKLLHNFNKTPMGKSVSTLFKFSNTGESPLLIKEVTTACGCTVPEWSKEIIEPNENGEIKIVYDAKYPGLFNKTITVSYNGKDSPQVLTIKGEVSYPEEKENAYSNKIN